MTTKTAAARSPIVVGDKVRYARPIDTAEHHMRFTLIEDNGDRVKIELISDDTIRPVEIVAKSEIIPAH